MYKYKKRRNTMLYVILLHTTKSNNIKLIDFAFLVEITSRNNIISKYLLRTKYFFSARLKGYLEKGNSVRYRQTIKKIQSIRREILIKSDNSTYRLGQLCMWVNFRGLSLPCFALHPSSSKSYSREAATSRQQ